MTKKIIQGLHPSLNIEKFLAAEKNIIHGFLAKEWLITREGVKSYGKVDYRYIIAKPPKVYTDLFNLIREFVIVFSPFEEFQPRTLNVIDKIQDGFESHRIEKICSVIISKCETIDTELNKVLLSNPEAQIVVPFTYSDFKGDSGVDLIKNRFKDHFFTRDLFAFRSELKKDLYFFGRNEIIQKLVSKHNSNENSGLFGLRKTGKTSILHGVKRVLIKEKTLTVIINCQSPSFNLKNWNKALFYIINEIKEQNSIVQKVKDEIQYYEGKAVESFEKDLVSILKKSKSSSILIIFDEIEHITFGVSHIEHWKSGFDSLKFWQSLRSIFQKDSNVLTFLIAGTNPKSIEITSIKGVDNPIFELIPKDSFVESFSVKQVEEMVSNLGRIMGLEFDDIIYSKLKEDFGGHPFLIRQVCSQIHNLIKTDRPARVDKTVYENAIIKYNSNNTAYNEMILDVLKDFFTDEYEMLKYLALDEVETFKEFIAISPSYIHHLLGYGIIDENNGEYHFKIESIKNYLANKNKYKRTKLSLIDKQKEISERRNNLEPKLRLIVRRVLFAKFGENQAKNIVLRIMGQDREKKYYSSTLKEIFNPNESIIYFEDIRKVVSKEWSNFENIFAKDKSEFNTYMNNVNKYRVDAHAKSITDEEMALFRVSITKIESQIDNYL